MKNKVISLFLAATMVLSLCPGYSPGADCF